MARTPSSLPLFLRARIHPTRPEHRVTTLELLFDLVFVYAITNVTALTEHHPGGRSLLEGAIVLSIIWFGWCSYAWLGNQAKADEGVLRLTMILAMAGMFFVAVAVPNAFAEHSNAAVVLAIAFVAVRLVHIAVYIVAAGDNDVLRSALVGMFGVILAMSVPLLVGAFVAPHERVWWWVTSVLIDQAGVFLVRSTRWTLTSASHFAERFGLIVIIAIGESVVDAGTASSRADITARLALALLCGVSIAVSLWWLYFDSVAIVAERVLGQATGLRRVRLARDSYTYLHLPIVAGIVSAAMGLTLLIEDGEHVAAGRYALYGGLVLYLVGHLLFRLRNIGSVNKPRLVVMALLVLLIPAVRTLPAVAQLAVPALVLIGLIVLEVRLYADQRRRVRAQADSGEPVGL